MTPQKPRPNPSPDGTQSSLLGAWIQSAIRGTGFASVAIYYRHVDVILENLYPSRYSRSVPSQPTPTHPLQQRVRPVFEAGESTVTLVDLFSGCGGLSLGVAQACHERNMSLDIRLAADLDPAAVGVFQTNFPKAVTAHTDVDYILSGQLGDEPTDRERRLQDDVGITQLLVAGPPCQGHSDLNNHTRRDDPKNKLYLKVARAVEILKPDVVLIENVPSVRHDKNQAVTKTRGWLEHIGYQVADAVIPLETLGIPQRRRRHVLLSIRGSQRVAPDTVLAQLLSQPVKDRDLRWAIGDLAGIDNGSGIDRAPAASSTNLSRMHWLLANGKYDLPNDRRPHCHQNDQHSYVSMYGRLHWDKPAQTITSGFGSIGQGRYMHPEKTRALTPHEAARIQGFPDYFEFSPLPTRASLATMIANAVPPELCRSIIGRVLPSLNE
jgi:DNA (cytosine-5)-methyltransferase 1